MPERWSGLDKLFNVLSGRVWEMKEIIGAFLWPVVIIILGFLTATTVIAGMLIQRM